MPAFYPNRKLKSIFCYILIQKQVSSTLSTERKCYQSGCSTTKFVFGSAAVVERSNSSCFQIFELDRGWGRLWVRTPAKETSSSFFCGVEESNERIQWDLWFFEEQEVVRINLLQEENTPSEYCNIMLWRMKYRS